MNQGELCSQERTSEEDKSTKVLPKTEGDGRRGEGWKLVLFSGERKGLEPPRPLEEAEEKKAV